MHDFLERAGGLSGNNFSKEYLEAELDEDSGACCTSFNDEGDSSSDGDDDGSRRQRRQKRKGKGPPDRRGVKKGTVMEAIEKGAEQVKATGDAMVQQMRRDTQRTAGDLLDEAKKLSKAIDELEDKIQELERDPDRSEIRLARQKEQLDLAMQTYDQAKKAHGRALAAQIANQ